MNLWSKILIVALIIFVIFAYFAGTFNPASSAVEKLIDEQVKKEKAKYERVIQERDAWNEQLSTKLVEKEKQYREAQKTIVMLKKEMNNVKPPQSMQETVARANALGYHPVVRQCVCTGSMRSGV